MIAPADPVQPAQPLGGHHASHIDTGSYSFPYVARWAEDKAVLRRNLAEVQGVAAGLIGGDRGGRTPGVNPVNRVVVVRDQRVPATFPAICSCQSCVDFVADRDILDDDRPQEPQPQLIPA